MPQGVASNVWRHFWLPQVGGGAAGNKRRKGRVAATGPTVHSPAPNTRRDRLRNPAPGGFSQTQEPVSEHTSKDKKAIQNSHPLHRTTSLHDILSQEPEPTCFAKRICECLLSYDVCVRKSA